MLSEALLPCNRVLLWPARRRWQRTILLSEALLPCNHVLLPCRVVLHRWCLLGMLPPCTWLLCVLPMMY